MAILDDFGLADLSMRRIATALGVQPGALYWHFANKQSLLAALAEEQLRGLRAATARAYAQGLREALLAHRDGAELVATVLSMRLLPSPAVRLEELLVAEGVAEAISADAAVTLVNFVIGHTLDEQGHAQMVALGVVEPSDDDPVRRFERGLDLFLGGIPR